MKHPFGLFDVDCLELNEAGDGLCQRSRVAPIAEGIESMRQFARRNDLPTVFTTCCSARMPGPQSLSDVLFVPCDFTEGQWRDRLGEFHMFYVEKKAYGVPRVNYNCRAYDMFQDNHNVASLVRALDVGEWLVFGSGFDLCVYSAVRGLIASGQKVCLISDLWVSAARGYDECGTPENHARILAEFEQLGVRMIGCEEFLSSVPE